MNLKWTELGQKIWATITHDHELKICKNMSQIHELNWTERRWSAISFIISYLWTEADVVRNVFLIFIHHNLCVNEVRI